MAPYKHVDYDSSILLVQQNDAKATAVHLGQGYFLTAAHILLPNQNTVNLLTNKNNEISASVVWVSKAYDIAFMHTTDERSNNIEHAAIDCRPLIFGEDLRFAGNPDKLNFINIWGKVAGDYQNNISHLWHRVIPVNVTIVPGMSGGPALDYKGNIRGINVGGLLYNMMFSSSFTNISFIVSSEDICHLLNRR